MAELPILPLKTDAILADTTHMSPEEFGVYCRILFVMWRHDAKLRDDDSEMASIGGVTLKRWKAIKEKVMRPMTVIGGLVSQKRLTDTWMNVQELRRVRAHASNEGWKSRPRAKRKQMHNQEHQQMESSSNANQNQISKSSLPSFTELRPKKEEGSLATALVDSALREPKEERKQETTNEPVAKPVSQLTRDELAEMFAKRSA